MKREMEIQLMIDDLVGEQKIDFYSNSNRDLLDKLKKRTALEYAEYLQYEIERLDNIEEIEDFIVYEKDTLFKEGVSTNSEEEKTEAAIKLNLCNKVLRIMQSL